MSTVVIACMGMLASCDKDIDLGEPAADSGSVVSGSGSGSESGDADSSASATSTSGSTGDDSSEVGSSGSTVDLTGEYYLTESEFGWPVFHFRIDDGSGELLITVNEAFFNETTGEWSHGDEDSVMVEDAEIVDGQFQMRADGVLLDGVPGVADFDVVLEDDVLCGTMAYGYGSPDDPVAAWGFRIGAGVEETAMSACAGE